MPDTTAIPEDSQPVLVFRQALLDIRMKEHFASQGYRFDCPCCHQTRTLTFDVGDVHNIKMFCHGDCGDNMSVIVKVVNLKLENEGFSTLDPDMFFSSNGKYAAPVPVPPAKGLAASQDSEDDETFNLGGREDSEFVDFGSSLPIPNDSDSGSPKRKYKVTRLSDVEAETVHWLWDGRLPLGKLVIFDGDPDMGKSTLMLDIGARVSTGAKMPDESGPNIKPSNVIIMSAEDGLADTISPRLEAADADKERIDHFDSVVMKDKKGALVEVAPSLPRDIEALEQLILDTEAKLVIIDVLVAYLDDTVSTSSDQKIRRALRPMADLAERTAACIVCLRHFTKSATDGREITKAIHAGGGSIGITGAARVGLVVGHPPNQDEAYRSFLDEFGPKDGSIDLGLLANARILAVGKNNLCPKPPSLAYELVNVPELEVARVRWLGEVNVTADELLKTKQSDRETELDKASNWLRGLLAHGPMLKSEILSYAEIEGISKATLDRARDKLAIVVERDDGKQGRPSTWGLP